MPETVAGIVLAGGLSRRMGRDKALLRLQGQTLLQRACGLLAAAGATPVQVSGPYPERGGLPDQVPRCGPLGGLHTVMQVLDDGWAWVVPVDMPALNVAMLRRLCDEQRSSAVIYAGHPLPMLLHVDANSRTLVADRVLDRFAPHSLHALQRALGAQEIMPATHELAGLANCNTPEQWKETVT